MAGSLFFSYRLCGSCAPTPLKLQGHFVARIMAGGFDLFGSCVPFPEGTDRRKPVSWLKTPYLLWFTGGSFGGMILLPKRERGRGNEPPNPNSIKRFPAVTSGKKGTTCTTCRV